MSRKPAVGFALLLLHAVTQPACAPSVVPAAAPTTAASGPEVVHVAAPTGEREVDRASILAALEQVHPGGTIQFAPGTYQMGELLGDAARGDKMVRVTVPGVTLQGHPDGTTLRYCDPANFPEHEVELFACDGLVLEAPRQTVRGLTFEYFQEGLYVGCCFDLDAVDPASFRVGGHPGGHLIEGNTFRNSGYSIRVTGDFAEPVVIRQNRFINTVHAVGIVGSMIHFLANDISAPEPGAVRPYPSNAIVIGPLMSIFPPPRRTVDHTYCARNIVEGNRIEGHVSGIWIGTVPGSSCVGNVIRDNTIIVQRTGAVSPPPGARMIVESDSTLIGPPLWLRPFPFDQDADDTESGVIEDNLIEGNRIIGAEGIGIEVWNASRNRFVNNTITGVVQRQPFPGNLMGDWNQAWRDANGSGIWISPGSNENEIIGNSFADIAGSAIYIEGDRNRVETRSAADAVRDLGSGNQVTAATAIRSDTVHVAPPTGEREVDRASILAAVERVVPGGTVQFAPGTYIVGRLIKIATPGITLLGHPDGTTLHGCEASRFDDVGRDMAATWLGELGPDESLASVEGCDIFELTGGHATVRGLTFERAWSGLLLGCCEAEFQIRPTDGGYLIEDNLFRNIMNGVRATLWAPEPTVIRRNRFVNTFHAVVWFGSRLHMFDNHVSVPEPARLSVIGFPAIAIGVLGGTPPRPATLPVAEYTAAVPCDENVIGGNHVEGHPDGITLVAFPGPSCRRNVLRDNTIVVSTPSFDRSRPAGRSFGADDTAPSVITGVPLSLFAVPDQDGRSGGVEESVVEGNRVAGAHGVGIELVRASGNRIANNTITGIRSRNPFPGNVVGTVPEWADANGAGIWVSGGSDENEVVGNTFEDIDSHTIVLEGDRNRVQPRSVSDAVRDMGSGNRVGSGGGPAGDASGSIAGSSSAQEPVGSGRGPVIDVHRHAAAIRSAAHADSVLAWMDRHGVARAVLLVHDTAGLQWRERAPDRFVVSVSFPCHQGRYTTMQPCFAEWNGWPDPEWLRREHEAGRLHALGEVLNVYYGIPVTDERLAPYFALAEELDIPVGIHTGRGPPPERRPPGCCPNFDDDHGNPALLEPVLRRHPRLRVWLMHAGGPFLREAIALMRAYPNVHADMSILNSMAPVEFEAQSLRAFLDAGLGDRIMLGTDNLPLERILERMDSFDFIDDAQRRAILYDNAARFLRLKPNAIARDRDREGTGTMR